MKRHFLIVLAILFGILPIRLRAQETASQDIVSLFEQANALYAANEYAEAAALYEQCVPAGGAQAYYNLGNARFKQGALAQSILAYERCLRLQPNHKDARYNLQIAQSRITDNLTDNTSFFVAVWARSIRNLCTEHTWVILSIALFILALAGLLLFALSSQVWLRKTSFHTAWVALLISIIALGNASSLHERDTERAEAIITQGILNAKSSPDQSGTELFTLHEGTKVTITETLGDWCNIRVGNNEGWVQLTHLERI